MHLPVTADPSIERSTAGVRHGPIYGLSEPIPHRGCGNCRLIGIVTGGGTFGSEPYLIKLGNHVTVSGDVRFITHDGGVWVFREDEPDIDVFGPISIGNNVFIGLQSIIMPNVRVGNNVVIGAGSVVTKDVPDYALVVGVPGKILGWVSEAGKRLIFDKDGFAFCEKSNKNYQFKEGLVSEIK